MQINDLRWETIQFTERAALCFIVDNGRVLLIRKKKGLGAGKIDAPGGRLEAGETAIEAARRETEEEIGLVPEDVREKAELRFYFLSGYSLFCTVFFAYRWTGTMKETDEATPFWMLKEDIPYDNMWEDARLWLPPLLGGETLDGYFIYSKNEKLLDNMVVIRPGTETDTHRL
ncbi:MAG: NUDIX domain-containing protein [Spirochaetales bacterium]|nr:NUDIX domain-containing protein [Spirochaetales bacterium]